jgi:hypothetical protein
MADEHTLRMFRWRKQVNADRRVTAFGFRVAYAVADRTFRDTGCCKAFQAQLAADANGTTRGVQKVLKRFVEYGHLEIEDNSRRGLANRYRPIVWDDATPVVREGTNGGSYPVGDTYELPFVPPTNDGSGGVRTPVRTEHRLPHPGRVAQLGRAK